MTIVIGVCELYFFFRSKIVVFLVVGLKVEYSRCFDVVDAGFVISTILWLQHIALLRLCILLTLVCDSLLN